MIHLQTSADVLKQFGRTSIGAQPQRRRLTLETRQTLMRYAQSGVCEMCRGTRVVLANCGDEVGGQEFVDCPDCGVRR